MKNDVTPHFFSLFCGFEKYRQIKDFDNVLFNFECETIACLYKNVRGKNKILSYTTIFNQIKKVQRPLHIQLNDLILEGKYLFFGEL